MRLRPQPVVRPHLETRQAASPPFWLGVLIGLVIAACRSSPSPVLPPTSPTAAAAHLTPAPFSTSAPAITSASPTASRRALVVCLPDEPESLYLYAPPEPGRAHILAALYDGPVDHVNYRFQPALLEKLPGAAEGDVTLDAVLVQPGDTVVDALGRVVTLTAGIDLAQVDALPLTYQGFGSVRVPQMSVRFRLRPGVRWSDGQPLTADDSVFSFEVGRSSAAFDPRRDLAERTASYRAVDTTTVVWTGLPGYLDQTYPSFFWPPLPRHKYEHLSPADIAADAQANRSPLGWGPFVLREWVRGDHLTLERNPNYFRAAEGLPRLERVTYRFVPSDAAALLSELHAGACDVAPQNSAFAAATDLLLRAADSGGGPGGVRVQVVSADTFEHLDFSLAPAENHPRAVGADFFRDVRARRAFAYCLDREALARLVGPSPHRRGDPPAAYLPPSHPLHASALEGYAFDPRRGRALLAELGWMDSDGDGTLDHDGAPLSLVLAGGPAGDSLRDALLGEIQTQLSANCLVRIEVRPLTRGELEGDWPQGVIFGRRFDLGLFGWRVGSVPPCALFITAQIASEANPGGANNSGYSSPEFDRACQAALATLDPGRAAELHAEAQRLFARDLPILPLFFRVKVMAARAEVEGLTLDPTSPSELWNIEALAWAP